MTTVLLNKNAAHLHSMLQQPSGQKRSFLTVKITHSHTSLPTAERTNGASKA
ncbi:uncharacterized protein G2W53_010679 [Senna tora]|uniref:Uncharacterized protein n=1 Tax=Senna tora TaxID=362788 RepID=A0A834WZR6_9FABA|nr:uncharacterized protein G2W53_010679 [Senna tora]